MESNSNPFAPPSVQVANSIFEDIDSCPILPLVFRPSLLTYATALPIGFVALGLTGLFGIVFLSSIFESSSTSEMIQYFFSLYSLIAMIVLLIGALVAFACLSSLWCRVAISDSSIDSIDLKRRIIEYSEIESWHHHPATGSVSISFKSRKRFLILDSWAMSRKKSHLLGRVLRTKVGPPR